LSVFGSRLSSWTNPRRWLGSIREELSYETADRLGLSSSRWSGFKERKGSVNELRVAKRMKRVEEKNEEGGERSPLDKDEARRVGVHRSEDGLGLRSVDGVGGHRVVESSSGGFDERERVRLEDVGEHPVVVRHSVETSVLSMHRAEAEGSRRKRKKVSWD